MKPFFFKKAHNHSLSHSRVHLCSIYKTLIYPIPLFGCVTYAKNKING